MSQHANNSSTPRTTRRIVFVAAPGTEILDLVGPLQVFARAAEMFGKQNPGSSPIYSIEVISASSQRSLVTNCGVRIAAHKTFREVRGKIDTLLIAGGNAIEQDEINPDIVRWLRKMAGRIRRIGSVCTGAMMLARAGLLDGGAAGDEESVDLSAQFPKRFMRGDPNTAICHERSLGRGADDFDGINWRRSGILFAERLRCASENLERPNQIENFGSWPGDENDTPGCSSCAAVTLISSHSS